MTTLAPVPTSDPETPTVTSQRVERTVLRDRVRSRSSSSRFSTSACRSSAVRMPTSALTPAGRPGRWRRWSSGATGAPISGIGPSRPIRRVWPSRSLTRPRPRMAGGSTRPHCRWSSPPARSGWPAAPRLALLIPIMAAAGAAVVAGRIQRHLDPERGTVATWVVGLSTPLAVYALDFWEHSLGVFLMALGVLGVLNTGNGSKRFPPTVYSLGAGLAFGFAATMRQEALVYGFVAGVVTDGRTVQGRPRKRREAPYDVRWFRAGRWPSVR